MGEKSRKEKRKESRTVKKQTKFSSWIKHLKSSKTERIGSNPCVTVAFKPANLEDLNAKLNGFSKERICNEEHSSENPKGAPVSSNQSDESSEVFLGNFACPGMTTHESHGDKPVAGKKTTKKILNRTRKKVVSDLMDPKANFQYLEMETNKGFFTEFDLEMEKKLAKKLKVKGGKLSGLDGLDDLIEDIPYAIDSEINQSFDVGTAKSSGCVKSRKKNKRRKLMDASELSGKVASDMKLIEGSKEQENEKMIQWSNDLAEHKGTQNDFVEVKPNDVHALSQNLELEDPCSKEPALDNVGKYVPPQLRSRAESDENYMFRRRVKRLLNKLNESSIESTTGEMSSIFQLVGRSIACQTIGEELLAYAGGPRSSEHFAAVYAAFVAGMACLVGIDFSAKIIASLAKAFEAEYSKGDSLSVETLARLFSYMCNFGVCSSDLIYDFLSVLSKRLMELDVSAIKIMLECCGMKLRGDDPAAMKDFILGVQQRANELQTVPVSTPNGYPGITNKRMEILLQMICDIKNNKKRTKEDSVPHTWVKKWLQKLGVENVLLRGLKWSKLLDPHKKGQWWLSGDTITSAKDNAAEIAGKIDREVLDAQKLLRLAAAQRMNTDSRKAIFCIIMSSEDYIDAFEKILRLDLPGKQDREIMRVLVECCLQEKVFNKYYSVLASKLCSHDKNHKFTLQYCLWDHFKQLESMELSRSMNLARFIAEMLTSFSLSLAVLKSVDLGNPKLLTAKWVMHFRMLFEAILEHPDALVWNIFTRIAVAPELEWLRSGIEFFVKQYVTGTSRVPAEKFKVLKKALNNVAGILM